MTFFLDFNISFKVITGGDQDFYENGTKISWRNLVIFLTNGDGEIPLSHPPIMQNPVAPAFNTYKREILLFFSQPAS